MMNFIFKIHLDAQTGIARMEVGQKLHLDLTNSLWGENFLQLKSILFANYLNRKELCFYAIKTRKSFFLSSPLIQKGIRQNLNQTGSIQLFKDSDVKSEKMFYYRFKSSKYSLVTFLPLNLIEQFRRVANFYFLVRK